MKRAWYILLSLLICVGGFAKSQVNIIFENNDKSKVEKLYKLETMPDGAQRLTIPVCDIERGIKKVSVISDDYQANKGEDGYFIMPALMGNQIFFKFDNSKYQCHQLQMPFWGAKTPKGTYVAIAKGLELEYTLVAETKNGLHKMYPRYDIDKIDFDPYEDIVIDFYDLGKKATYVDMAKVYRKYQLDRGEVKPLRERVKNNPTLKYSVESPFVRVKLAHNKHPKGIGGFNSPKWDKITPELHVAHTFDSFIDIMRKMYQAGVKEADMCFVGWQVGGFDGYFPDLFPVEERLGGEAKMREAVKIGKELGYHMTTHINNHNMYKRAKGWSDEFVSKNRKGEPRTYVYWPGGQAYHTCFQTICDRYMDKDIAKLKDMGMNAPQHVDVTSAIRPSPCCDALHPNNRKQQAQHQIRLGEKYRKNFGGFTSEAGFDHCAKVLDYALYTSTASKGKAFVEATEKRLKRKMNNPPMVEFEILPLWQIVYHGIILSNVDWYTIDCYLKPKGHKLRLKFIECGGRPTFYWTKYKKQSDIDGIAEAYREYVPMRYLQYEFMDRHEEIAKNVFLTGYSDGSEVVVNYTKKPFEYKGQVVEARDYRLFKPSK
ncbi:MAG: hypothetical protein E7035_04000 [Verrucomicrobiaceae bacterium]|nr:hypothetical protein [Verrucomicrobiaceae bacterium]